MYEIVATNSDANCSNEKIVIGGLCGTALRSEVWRDCGASCVCVCMCVAICVIALCGKLVALRLKANMKNLESGRNRS